MSDILRFPIPADTGLHQKRLRRLIHTDLVCGAISMLQEVSQNFIRLRPRFTAVVTRPDRRLCPTTPAEMGLAAAKRYSVSEETEFPRAETDGPKSAFALSGAGWNELRFCPQQYGEGMEPAGIWRAWPFKSVLR
jgi:hypothetical protein